MIMRRSLVHRLNRSFGYCGNRLIGVIVLLYSTGTFYSILFLGVRPYVRLFVHPVLVSACGGYLLSTVNP